MPLLSYSDVNPFGQVNNVYSLGANVTSNLSPSTKGLIFTNSVNIKTLDTAGTATQFTSNAPVEVVLEIGQDGVWSYSIGGVFESSGMIPEGFDLDKSYHIAIYAQDDETKSIQCTSRGYCRC